MELPRATGWLAPKPQLYSRYGTPVGYQFRIFRFDRVGDRLSRDSEILDLAPKLLDLLLYLLEQPAALVTKEELLDALWPGATILATMRRHAGSFALLPAADTDSSLRQRRLRGWNRRRCSLRQSLTIRGGLRKMVSLGSLEVERTATAVGDFVPRQTRDTPRLGWARECAVGLIVKVFFRDPSLYDRSRRRSIG